MKQFDLTGIGSSVELGKGGSVILDNNGDVLVNGKDVHSGIKGTWPPSELTAQTSLPWEVGTTGVVTLSNNDFTASFPGSVLSIAKITNFNISGSEQGVYFTFNTANITSISGPFGIGFSADINVDSPSLSVAAVAMFTYVAANTFTVSVGSPLPPTPDMSSSSAQFTLTPTTQCCVTVDDTNTIRFYVDDNTGPTQSPIISHTISGSPNTSSSLIAFVVLEYGTGVINGTYSLTILDEATELLDGVNPGTGITPAFPTITNTGNVDETDVPTNCANLSYIVDLPEGTKLNTSKGFIRKDDIVTFGPLETIIGINSDKKSILDITVGSNVIQPLVPYAPQAWLDFWINSKPDAEVPLSENMIITATDPALLSPAMYGITNNIMTVSSGYDGVGMYPIQQFGSNRYFSLNIQTDSITPGYDNRIDATYYYSNVDAMLGSSPGVGGISTAFVVLIGISNGLSVDPTSPDSTPNGTAWMKIIGINIDTNEEMCISGDSVDAPNVGQNWIEFADLAALTAAQVTMQISSTGTFTWLVNGQQLSNIWLYNGSWSGPVASFNLGGDLLEDEGNMFYISCSGTYAPTNVIATLFLTDTDAETNGYTSFYTPTTNDPSVLETSGPGDITTADLYPGYFNRLVYDTYVNGELLDAGRIISVSDSGVISALSTTDDVTDLSNYAVISGTSNTFSNTNTFSGGTDYVPGEPEVPEVPEVPATSGYIIIDYSTNADVIANSGTFSGIENNGVGFNPGYGTSQADIAVDGGGNQNVAISITQFVTTWQDILNAINTQTTGCVASFVGGTIKITSDTTGILSIVNITDGSPNILFGAGNGIIQSPVYGEDLVPAVPAVPSTIVTGVPDVSFTHSILAKGVEVGTQTIHDGIAASSKSILKGESVNGVYPVIETYIPLMSPPTFNTGMHFGGMIGEYNNDGNFVDFGLTQQSTLNLEIAPSLNILRFTKNTITGYFGNIQEPNIDDQTVFGWLNVNKPDNQHRPNIYLAGANLELSEITWVESPSILGIQLDATLDPGVTPSHGDTYLIFDKDNLHANFGVIAGVANNDIVEYNTYFSPPVFEVVFTATLNTCSTTSYNGQELFFNGANWAVKTIISQTNFSTNQHETSGRIRFNGQDRDIIIGEQNYDPYITDILLDVLLQEDNRFINAVISEDAFVGVAMDGAATSAQNLIIGIIGDPTITNNPENHVSLSFIRNPNTDTNSLLLSTQSDGQTYFPFVMIQDGTETNVTLTSYGVGDLILRNYDTDASPPAQTSSIAISKTGIVIDSGVGNNTTVDKDPTVAMGVATKQYVDTLMDKTIKAFTVVFNHDDTSPLDIGPVLPNNTLITRCIINITETFDDVGASPPVSIIIGNALDPDGILSSGQTDVTALGIQGVECLFDVTTSGQLQITIDPGASAQGSGRLLIEYFEV